MAGKKRAITHVKTAPQIAITPFQILQRCLESVGKPIYLLLKFSILGLVYLFKAVKKIRLPKFTIPKINIKIKNFRSISFFLLLSLFIFAFWFYILKGLPSPKDLTTRQQDVSTKIYDRNGVLLYKIYKNQNRTLVSLKQIPLIMQQATLAAEDAEFYQHMGISVRGILRSVVSNIREGKLTGGSTITQQLVKNALLSPEKTVTRKVKELILSVATELTYSKEQILEMYLNEVPYGGTAYGVEEAAQEYFGKQAKDLDLAEAALLAGLPKSPTNFSPFGVNPNLAINRQHEVLNLMVINKFITQEQALEAENETLVFIPNTTNIKAPHFVMFVKQALVDRYGEETVQKGGLEVYTTLDLGVQTLAEQVVAGEIGKLANVHVGNGAALVIDPQKGDILAMVGSKDYFDINADGNVNVTTSPRQPGSSIKIVNYAYALSHNFTPASILDDSPVAFNIPGSPIYRPVNYDGQYKGKITLRQALAQSRNIPAVKTLASYGVDKMLALGKDMGITTWTNPSQYGLSLTLGGGEVKLLDLAQVYATVADYGVKPEIKYITEVKNSQGEILENNTAPNSVQILDSRVAYQLIDILRDNPARAPAFGFNSALVIKDHPEVAVKTGTSNNFKDNLTLGFNQKYLVAVWVGNNDSSPMSHIVSGVTGAAPIFNKIMTGLLQNEPSIAWDIPAGLVKSPTCNGQSEWFLAEASPKILCVVSKPPEDKSQILDSGASTQL